VEMASVAAHPEDANEEAAVETVGALAIWRHEPRAMVGPSRSWPLPENRRAVPQPRKGHGRQGPGKGDVVRGTPKGRTFEKRRRE
jgi:hypothetical protein